MNKSITTKKKVATTVLAVALGKQLVTYSMDVHRLSDLRIKERAMYAGRNTRIHIRVHARARTYVRTHARTHAHAHAHAHTHTHTQIHTDRQTEILVRTVTMHKSKPKTDLVCMVTVHKPKKKLTLYAWRQAAMQLA